MCTIYLKCIGHGTISMHNLLDASVQLFWLGLHEQRKQKKKGVSTVLLSVFVFIMNLITIATLSTTITTLNHITYFPDIVQPQ